ncbi:2-dehydro-3-deoxygalactonokinase [Actibacterium mucosum]|nr:2-dehydro-3-deoxygalactonokinase [Actibacterium mucosum]
MAVDWGSSRFRAWLIDESGRIMDRKDSDDGLKFVNSRKFSETLADNCGDWMRAHPHAPVIMCGMVGSKTGWFETPYLDCPLDLDRLVAAAYRFDIGTHPAAIIPGAVCRSDAGHYDVMRGEELQILGSLADEMPENAVICIPGTHCKWVEMRDGHLQNFRSYITGELFALLRNNSLVGALAEGDAYCEATFLQGVTHGARNATANAVFSARADVLNGQLAPQNASSFLSGTLIGTEIATEQQGMSGTDVILLASGPQAQLYQVALAHCGLTPQMRDAKGATLAGLSAAAQALWPSTAAA